MNTKKTLRSINNTVGKPKETFKKLSIKLFSNFGSLNYRRFIVLTRSRTGSTMLISFLNSHPNIYAEGEIFRKLNGQNYKDILVKTYAKQPGYIKAKGFKIFYFHPIDDDSNNLWDELISLDNLSIIHLKRRNILRTIVSRKIASTQKVWATKSAKRHSASRNKSVSFTTGELEQGFKKTRAAEDKGDKEFSNHPLVTVYYEDLVINPEGEFGKVTEFLGVKYVPPKTHLKKQNPESLKVLIKNYNELKSAFSGTEWQQFFDE